MSRFVRSNNKNIYMILVIFILFFSVLNISIVITDGATLPSIAYFDAHPYVQGKNGFVNIICIVTDNIEIQKVEVIITPPNGMKMGKTMTWSSDGKYVYKDTYDIIGRYSFYIVVEDKAGNENVTASKVFWITLDLEDTDSDGMPDWWEEKYNFDPENLIDAYKDTDGDGYTNLKEYEIGTNPSKNIFIQNAAYRMSDNIEYLAASVFLFIVIVLLSVYGKRRRFT